MDSAQEDLFGSQGITHFTTQSSSEARCHEVVVPREGIFDSNLWGHTFPFHQRKVVQLPHQAGGDGVNILQPREKMFINATVARYASQLLSSAITLDVHSPLRLNPRPELLPRLLQPFYLLPSLNL